MAEACVETKETRVLFLGHSYVNRLAETLGAGRARDCICQLTPEREITARFFGISGATVEQYLTGTPQAAEVLEFWNQVTEFRPHISVVILGGNDLLLRIPLDEVKQGLVKLQDRLISATQGEVIQVGPEMRVHLMEVQMDMPDYPKFVTYKEYGLRRISLRTFLGRKSFSKRRPHYYYLHLDTKIFDEPKNYMSDGFHLSKEALGILWRKICSALDYVRSNPRGEKKFRMHKRRRRGRTRWRRERARWKK